MGGRGGDFQERTGVDGMVGWEKRRVWGSSADATLEGSSTG
jgi:hypothetical protein